ncbi:unnamed protein product [Closterium sp. NIES-64]|nr:unnamed protein product [Closterium sp. NIES-64]
MGFDPDEVEREEEEEEEEGDDVNGEDDDEEEEEGQDEYEKDGWMVDGDEEEEEGGEGEEEEGGGEEGPGSDEERREKKKKKRRKREEEEDELDEDDYALLQESGVGGFHRPAKKDKKFRRLKKARHMGGDEDGLLMDDEEDEEGGMRAQQRVEREIFGDEDVPEDFQEREGRGEEEELEEEDGEEDEEEEDEMADFIVEGGVDDTDEHGRRRRKKKKKGTRMPGVTSEALLEAQDIFGDVADLLERRRVELERQRREGGEGGAGGYYYEDGMGAEGGEEYGREGAGGASALSKQYEPSLLEAKYMTERDEAIRARDVPERLQLLEEVVGVIPENEDHLPEAEWIYERVFGSLAPDHLRRGEFSYVADAERRAATCAREDVEKCRREAVAARDGAIEQIAAVLEELHDAKVEVPYIAIHKKAICPALVEQDKLDGEPQLQPFQALWAIQQWDRRWLLLQRRKRSLRSAYERPRVDEDEEAERQLAMQGVLHALDCALSEPAVEDVDAKFNLQFPPEEAVAEEGGRGGAGVQQRRPRKRSMYSVCRRAGLKGVVKRIGLSAFQLGENLISMYKQHEVEDTALSPEEVATEYICAEFPSPALVLRGARHMAEVEISIEPKVREHVREIFNKRAIVSTNPTPRGRQVIDTFHRFAGIERLKDKPVGEFRDDQWLLIAKAESQGLVKVELGLPPAVVQENVIQEFEAAYLSDGVSHFASLWNEQRRTILRAAIAARLLPTMHKETRLLLTGRAKAFVAEQCALALWKHVSVAPFDVRAKGAGGGGGGGMGGGGGGGMRGGGGRGGRHGGGEEHGGGGQPWLRVMACCWGPGNPATTFAMLNAAGEMVDFLHTGFLWGGGGGEQQVMVMKKREDERRLMAFVKEHKPHVVVVGGANLACERLKDEIWEVIFKIVEHFPRDLTSDVDNVRVVFQDETLALLYENSAISQEHLPSQPGIVRRTVGLGRYMQNRLALAACLFGPAREVLSAKFHRSQDLLPPDDVYDALERVMVTVTNQVGVDVNYAAQEAQDWLFAPLQFVCGLGPRKASTLKVRILGEGVVRRRKDLIDPPFLLDQVVFINAAAFIRVRGQDDMLDDSRIHPADYRLALKVATDGYCEAHRGMTPHSVEERGIDVVLEARDNPDLIRRLDFEDYAVMLARKGQGGLKEKLLLIRRELMHGFAECRVQFESLNADEQFWLLSGETEESLAVGKVVTATVKRVLKFKVLCALESGVLGEVDRRDFSDDPNVELRDVVSEGQPLTCRIKEVKTEEAKVILTCKGSDLRSSEWREMRQWDPYYQRAAVEQEEQAATEERKRKEEEKRKTAFRPRMITYPLFHNVSLEGAKKVLADKDVGSVVIRPSSRGPTHLSITMKLPGGAFTHVDVHEGGKDRTSATSFLRLGRTLTIGDESYEDLDEVMARYIEPLAARMRDMAAYRKFRLGSKGDMDALVRTDKEREPARIPYYLSLSHDHPGAFMLTYIRSASVSGRPVHEYITVSPEGFRFRKHTFPTPDRLVKYFQAHFNDPVEGGDGGAGGGGGKRETPRRGASGGGGGGGLALPPPPPIPAGGRGGRWDQAGSGGWGAVGGGGGEKLGWGGGAWSAGGGGEQGGGQVWQSGDGGGSGWQNAGGWGGEGGGGGGWGAGSGGGGSGGGWGAGGAERGGGARTPLRG